MDQLFLTLQNLMRRIMAARIVPAVTIATAAMAAGYILIHIAVLLLLLAFGHSEPIGASAELSLLTIEEHFPHALFLSSLWTVFILVESLKMGCVFRSVPEALALPAVHFPQKIFRFSESLFGLTSANRIDPHILPVPALSGRALRTCHPSPLPEDAWPSTNPKLIYH